MRLRVATWNIHQFVGTDRVVDARRTLDTLRTLDADIIGLQEYIRGGRSTPAPGSLARAIDRYVYIQPTCRVGRGYQANVLATRWPLWRVERLPYAASAGERRGALIGTFDHPDGRVNVAVTHLSLRPGWRLRQAGTLRTHLHGSGTEDWIVLGDFNEWLPWAGVNRRLGEWLRGNTPLGTFPSRWPVLPLDRIWVAAGWRFLNASRVDEAVRASDHRALVADVARDP